MYINSGYLNNSKVDFKEKVKPLVVGSCGDYRLITREKLPTWRPRGRLDYQLLYVASGKAYFYFNGKERMVPAGHMVLYWPKEEQKYVYYGTDKTEVFWVHFTGRDVKNILRQHGLFQNDHVLYCGSSIDYQNIFNEMIQELQMCKIGYEDMLVLHLRRLFLILQRSLQEQHPTISTFVQKEIELARFHFIEHYNEDISIEDYSTSRGMSTCWFIRNFKQITGSTPMQYILTIRMNNAQGLLEDSDYNVTEISNIVGYDNPLYFSRIFKKQKGVSPSEYRKQIRPSNH